MKEKSGKLDTFVVNTNVAHMVLQKYKIILVGAYIILFMYII